MRLSGAKVWGVLVATVVLFGCSSDKKSLTLSENPQDEIVEAQTEELKGRVDVYTSMARAVKYNINTIISADDNVEELCDKIMLLIKSSNELSKFHLLPFWQIVFYEVTSNNSH